MMNWAEKNSDILRILITVMKCEIVVEGGLFFLFLPSFFLLFFFCPFFLSFSPFSLSFLSFFLSFFFSFLNEGCYVSSSFLNVQRRNISTFLFYILEITFMFSLSIG